jgi:U1 small nuclear ribonucleoprotein C
MSLPGGVARPPRLPILPTPFMQPGAPLMPGVRPPIFPTPGVPGKTSYFH